MRKFVRLPIVAFCAVIASSMAAFSVSAADCNTLCVPGVDNVNSCVVSLNNCGTCDVQSILSNCGNADVQKIIQQCGILPDNTQCTSDNGGTTVPDTPSGQSAVSQTPSAEPQKQTTADADYEVNDYEKQVIVLINNIRKENGLSEITMNTELCKVARLKAQDMHNNQYFSHTSPTYGSPFDMMKQFGITYRTAGENIAMGQTTPQAVVDAWMNSDGHRANILNASYTQIGMGYVSDGNYWSQMFIG